MRRLIVSLALVLANIGWLVPGVHATTISTTLVPAGAPVGSTNGSITCSAVNVGTTNVQLKYLKILDEVGSDWHYSAVELCPSLLLLPGQACIVSGHPDPDVVHTQQYARCVADTPTSATLRVHIYSRFDYGAFSDDGR